jgi:hypothetical protein
MNVSPEVKIQIIVISSPVRLFAALESIASRAILRRGWDPAHGDWPSL